MNTKYFLKELKSKLWLSIFFMICLTIVFTISYLSAIQSTNSYNVLLSDRFNIFSLLIYIPFLFFGTLNQFSFFHSKPKVDFYHGLPISRTNLLLTNYLVMPTLLTLPYFLFNLLAQFVSKAIIIRGSIFDYRGSYSYFFYLLIILTLSSILLYTLVVLIGTLCGSTVSHAITSILIFLSPFVFIVFTKEIASIVINRGISSTAFLENFFLFFVQEPNDPIMLDYNKVIIQVILIALMLFLSCKSYKNFKSEQAGNPFSSKIMTCIFLVIAPLMSSIFILLIISGVFDSLNKPYILTAFFIIISSITFFAIIVLQSFNKSKKELYLKIYGVLMLISLCYSFIIFGDGLNLAVKKPLMQDVAEIYINNSRVSKEDYDIITEFQQFAYDNGNNDSIYNFNNSMPDLSSPTVHFSFTYALNNGNYLNRTYYLPENTEAVKYLEKIFTSENYKQGYINYLQSDFLFGDEYAQISFFDGRDLRVSNIPALVDALVADIEKDTMFGQYNYQPLNLISIYISGSKGYNPYYSYYQEIKINPRYENTMKIIEPYYKAQFGANADIVKDTVINVCEDTHLSYKLNNVKKFKAPYLFTNAYYANEVKAEPQPVKTYTYYDKDNSEFLDIIYNQLFYHSDVNNVIPVTDGNKVFQIGSTYFIE